MNEENAPQLYKCQNCGFPLVIGFNGDNDWKYIDGFWKHECKKIMTTTEAKIIQAANNRVRRGGRLVIDHWIGVRERFSSLFNISDLPDTEIPLSDYNYRQAALYHDLRKFLSEDTNQNPNSWRRTIYGLY